MNRQEAINHIWGLSFQVANEFCVGRDEHEELRQDTHDALTALGVTPEETTR
jgi:hypothetical protein